VKAPRSVFENSVLRDYRWIIEYAPQLKRVSIQVSKAWQLRMGKAHIYGLDFTGQPGSFRPLDLIELSLSLLDLNGSMSLIQQVQFPRQKKLRLKGCTLDASFHDAIAFEFFMVGAMLEVLDIGSPYVNFRGQQSVEYMLALEALLDSFTGLKGLYIDYDALPRMVHVDCIIGHAAILERLSFGSWDSRLEYHRLYGEDLREY
jgi:hypothetical protein